MTILETPYMPTTVKDLMAAARAAVPAITPADAAKLVANHDALIVDVRDGTEVAASGKAKGAVAVSRGMLEFRADPESPAHDPAFRKDRPIILYCASGGRSALAGKTLLDMGFKDVRNLSGFKDWVSAGGEVENS
jgi:rhodanese-related sulfurtransferase